MIKNFISKMIIKAIKHFEDEAKIIEKKPTPEKKRSVDSRMAYTKKEKIIFIPLVIYACILLFFPIIGGIIAAIVFYSAIDICNLVDEFTRKRGNTFPDFVHKKIWDFADRYL